MSITVEQIIAATREEITARPDVIYSGICSYSDGVCTDGSVGCVFGQVFKKLGVQIDDKWNCVSIGGLLTRLKIPYTVPQRKWLLEIQSSQDRNETWSSVLKTADAVIPLPGNPNFYEDMAKHSLAAEINRKFLPTK